LQFVESIPVIRDLSAITIDKALLLIDTDNILNGRQELYNNAIEMFKNNVVLGNGIGSFDLSNFTYPHNLFLQIASESGVLLLIPTAYILGYGLMLCLRNRDKSHAIFVLFLFSISIPKLLFSSSFWIDQRFWLLIGYLFYIRFQKEQNIMPLRQKSAIQLSEALYENIIKNNN